MPHICVGGPGLIQGEGNLDADEPTRAPCQIGGSLTWTARRPTITSRTVVNHIGVEPKWKLDGFQDVGITSHAWLTTSNEPSATLRPKAHPEPPEDAPSTTKEHKPQRQAPTSWGKAVFACNSPG